MYIPTQLLLMGVCVTAYMAPLREMNPHASADGPYEPIVYAAIPLHNPVPVLQVLSRRPLSRNRIQAPSIQRPIYARPPYHEQYVPASHKEYEYPRYEHNGHQNFEDSYPHSSSYDQKYISSSASSQDGLTILYARPNPQGGFSYRRSPTKTVPKRSPPAPTTEAPVIIRVHRYRVVRDP